MLSTTQGIEILEHQDKRVERPAPVWIPIVLFVAWALLWGFGFWYFHLWYHWWDGYAVLAWVIVMGVLAFGSMLTCPITHPEQWTIRVHNDIPAEAWTEIQKKYDMKACTASDMWICMSKEIL
ncbi:MAG: hypothetical protein IJZ68_09305 [Bacteroidaceae bacterium]|nr:hypothetical protein [Bacteroidaceae bacterium]